MVGPPGTLRGDGGRRKGACGALCPRGWSRGVKKKSDRTKRRWVTLCGQRGDLVPWVPRDGQGGGQSQSPAAARVKIET